MGPRVNDDSQAVATSDYKSVVLIEASLGGCAAIFSSLTFFDDVAIREPGGLCGSLLFKRNIKKLK